MSGKFNQGFLNPRENICENRVHVPPFYFSLAENYANGGIGIQVHLSVPVVGDSRLCVLVRTATWPLQSDRPDSRECGVFSEKGIEDGEKNPPVFIDIRKMIQNPRDRCFPCLPSTVRLQRLDFCNQPFGNTKETAPSDLILERFGSSTDGKRMFFVGFCLCGKRKFPYQIVHGRTDVLKTVSDNQRDLVGDGNGNEQFTEQITVFVVLGHNLARFSVEISTKFGFEKFGVFFSPSDFETN